MLNCYVLDDELASVEIISDYVTRTATLNLLGASTNANDMLTVMAEDIKPDIAFLDIDMPGMNGLEMAGRIHKHTFVVLVTAHDKYALQAFEKGAVDYLLKLVSYDKFTGSVKKIQNIIAKKTKGPQEDGFFYIRGIYKGEFIHINPADLIYVEARPQHRVLLVTTKGNHVTSLTIKALELMLNEEHFMRVHKSNLINMRCIQRVDSNELRMSDESVVPIGRTYRPDVLGMLERKTLFTGSKKDLL